MEPVSNEHHIDPERLWFNTPDSNTLCRGGGNGPNHPSQLYAIKKYVKNDESFLDYGSGSATTWEAMKAAEIKVDYLGLDIIPKNVAWCQENFPDAKFEVNQTVNKIDKPNKSYDVVYSRHVVDHMDSFENGLDEHCRVAKSLVIIILWRPLLNQDEHNIKHIVEQGVTYEHEFTSDYSKKKVLEAIKSKEADGWQLVELAEGVGQEISKWDTVIVLQRS